MDYLRALRRQVHGFRHNDKSGKLLRASGREFVGGIHTDAFEKFKETWNLIRPLNET